MSENTAGPNNNQEIQQKVTETKAVERNEATIKKDRPRSMRDNDIFIGGKPFMNYVTGVVMQFTTKNADEVIVKSRGKFISRAVDVVEVASKRFLDGNILVKDIKIDSEGFKNEAGRDIRVSTMEIVLTRKK